MNDKKMKVPLLQTSFEPESDDKHKTIISPIEEREEVSPVLLQVLAFKDDNLKRDGEPEEIGYGNPESGEVVDTIIEVPVVSGRRKKGRVMPDYSNDSDFEYSGDFSFGGSKEEKKENEGVSGLGEGANNFLGLELLNAAAHVHEHEHGHQHEHGHTHSNDNGHLHSEHSGDHGNLHSEHSSDHGHSHFEQVHDHGHSHFEQAHDHGHSEHNHDHSHSAHSHEHSHSEHSHSEHSHSVDACPESENPLNNFISYFLPFLSESSHNERNKGTFNNNSIFTFIRQLATNKETKSIFRFLLLNFSFMFIQMIYSFRSKSLGLFSDSLHMLLDCSSLAIGLFAKLISKRIKSIFYEQETSVSVQAKPTPASKVGIFTNTTISKYPFGLARIETLAAFINGILLLSIVQDIFFQSIDRILNPISLKNINELLVVSILGLLVNLVGIFAFNHGHEEEEGGHSHSISALFGQQDADEHHHSHEDSECSYHQFHDDKLTQPKKQAKSTNENDQGIFLHILADTLGSLGVIVSTILLKFFPTFKILDPISSLFIIILILLSSVPLIKSSFVNLLLVLKQKDTFNGYSSPEALIKDLLNDIYETPGVLDIPEIKVWKDSSEGEQHGHSHGHGEDEDAGATKLIGYVHIQYADGENSTIIKKRCEKIIQEQYKLELFVQLENVSWGALE